MDQTRLDAIRVRCDEFLEWLEDGTEFREIEKHGKALSIDVLDMLAEVARLRADLAAMRTENLILTAEMGEQARRLAAMTAERDKWQRMAEAAERDFHDYVHYGHERCAYCIHDDECEPGESLCYANKIGWDWRGPQEGANP